jgi:hypothetical protein
VSDRAKLLDTDFRNIKDEMQTSDKPASVHPETPDGYSLVFIWKTSNFSSWQGNQGVARRRTLWYAAQASLRIDAATAKKSRFRMKTR